MTDRHDPGLDDELVSAVLDDEAGDDERAAVLDDPAARERLATFSEVAAQVGAPVEPLEQSRVDTMLEVALAATGDREDPEDREGGSDGPSRTVTGTPTPTGSSLFDRRPTAGRGRGRVLGAVAAAAAALVLLVGLGALLVDGTSGRSEDAASSGVLPSTTAGGGDDSGGSTSAESETAADAAASEDGAWLGAYPDVEALLAAVEDEGQAFSSGRVQAFPYDDQDRTTAGVPVCPSELEQVVGPHEVLGVARATLPDQDVHVVAATVADGTTRVVVLGAADCTVLAVRPL